MLGKLQKKIFIILTGTLLFLSACDSHAASDGAAVSDAIKIGSLPEPTRQDYDAYAAVLLNDAAFFDATAQDERHLSDYTQPPLAHRLLNTSDFCLSDIDSDGTEEVFLQYDSLDSYLVFDYEDGTVYGYCFHQPELYYLQYYLEIYENIGPCIKLRGDGGFCKIFFSHGEYTLIPIPEPASESSGYATWYAFTTENLLEVFLPDELPAYLAKQAELAAEWTDGWEEDGEAYEAFLRILNGDFSLIADVDTRDQIESVYWENIAELGACTWRYVLLEDDFGRQSLFMQSDEIYPSFFSALLYYDSGKLICAVLDVSDYHDCFVPLENGKLLHIYDYANTTTESIVQIDADFEPVWETEYDTVRIYYEMYEERDDPYSRYHDFTKNYDVITGTGEYYFVTESDILTYPKEQRHLSLEERREIERLFDEWIVPDSAWRAFPEKTDAICRQLYLMSGRYVTVNPYCCLKRPASAGLRVKSWYAQTP